VDESGYGSEPASLALILARTNAIGFTMASEPSTGALLRTLAAAKPNGRFLELGTGTGSATAWILDGMDTRSGLTSVDADPAVQSIAAEVLGDDQRLNLVAQDALVFLRNEKSESYDFVFADAMPGKYEGLDEALRVVRAGSFYVIDDMLPQPSWPPGHAEKADRLLAELAISKEFRVVPMAWSTGVVIAVKR
jgi:predicted O-methyltransferase YrrM